MSPKKLQLLELLNTPIKFGKIPEDARDAFMAAETEQRINAALELYDIEPSTPAEAKWCALAMYLLGAHFKGCRSLARQPGGAPKNSYSKPVEAFDAYCASARKGSQMAHATNFLNSQGGKIQVGNETITTPKALLIVPARKESGILTAARLLACHFRPHHWLQCIPLRGQNDKSRITERFCT